MVFQNAFRFIRPKELEKILGISRSRRQQMVREGSLPKPVRLGKRAIGWRSDEIEEAMANFARIHDAYEKSK